jgi:hypothetical protein
MNEHEPMQSALTAIASNPKVATAVAAGTASAGAATKFEILQGFLSLASMTVGIITALVVLAIQLIKLNRTYRAWMADQPEPKEPI